MPNGVCQPAASALPRFSTPPISKTAPRTPRETFEFRSGIGTTASSPSALGRYDIFSKTARPSRQKATSSSLAYVYSLASRQPAQPMRPTRTSSSISPTLTANPRVGPPPRIDDSTVPYPVVGATGKLPVSDRRVYRHRLAVQYHTPVAGTQLQDHLCPAAAATKVSTSPVTQADVQLSLFQVGRNVLNQFEFNVHVRILVPRCRVPPKSSRPHGAASYGTQTHPYRIRYIASMRSPPSSR